MIPSLALKYDRSLCSGCPSPARYEFAFVATPESAAPICGTCLFNSMLADVRMWRPLGATGWRHGCPAQELQPFVERAEALKEVPVVQMTDAPSERELYNRRFVRKDFSNPSLDFTGIIRDSVKAHGPPLVASESVARKLAEGGFNVVLPSHEVCAHGREKFCSEC